MATKGTLTRNSSYPSRQENRRKQDRGSDSKRSYGDKLRSSYDRGYRQGFNDALNHDRALGAHAAAAVGYYKGIKGRNKTEGAKKTLNKYTPSKGR